MSHFMWDIWLLFFCLWLAAFVGIEQGLYLAYGKMHTS